MIWIILAIILALVLMSVYLGRDLSNFKKQDIKKESTKSQKEKVEELKSKKAYKEICPDCKEEKIVGNFCPNCGTKFQKVEISICPNCGRRDFGYCYCFNCRYDYNRKAEVSYLKK